MASCCSRYMVPTAITTEFLVNTCTKCGDENFVFYTEARMGEWRENKQSPQDEVARWCSKRYPDAKPRIYK